MKRYPDWPTRLAHFVAANRARAFRWGEWDCCLFVCDAVLAMTGADVATRFRGRYDDEAGARALLAADGGVIAVATAAFGVALSTVNLAQRGDVALFPQPAGDTLGLVMGRDVAIVTPEGLRFIPLRVCTTAWRV